MTTNTELHGTIVAGRIELEQPVELPDSLRVAVTLRLIMQPATTDRREAWRRPKRRLSERPIHAGGEKFLRSSTCAGWNQRLLERMALPVWWQGFASGGGQCGAKLVAGLLHQRQHFRSAFVHARFDAAVAVPNALTARRLLTQRGHLLAHTDHGAQ